ncbi:MAG: uracil-DNA glycosylase [Thermodesulfobacteriota bacterium]
MSESAASPDCRACRHFYITHQPAHPYGCRAMGFISARLPASVVQENSGLPCQGFSPKPRHGVDG